MLVDGVDGVVPAKYLVTKALYYTLTINGGKDANNKTLADWLNTYGEKVS